MEKFFDGKTFGQKAALKLITTSPNTVAKMVEDTLGIKFSQPPVKIELNLPNRLLMTLFFPDTQLARSNSDLLRGQLEVGGRYFPEDNIYLVNLHDFHSEAAEIHENIHAFTYQTNPGLVKAAQAFSELFYAEQAADSHCALTLIEEYMTVRIFDEGIAEWGKSEVIDRSYRSRGQDPDIQRRVKFAQGIPNAPYLLNSYKSYLIGLEQFAINSLRLYQQVLNENNMSKKQRLLEEGHKNSGVLSYSRTPINWGPNFVDIVMDYLIGSGLYVSLALPLLIKNPPTHLRQLFDPMEYVSSISG